MIDFFFELIGAAFDFFVSEAICEAFYRPSQAQTLQPKNGIELI
jgi:hypothetical protein